MDGEQIRAARALLGWRAEDLARESGVSYPTIQRLDSTVGELRGRRNTIEKIRDTLEAHGIIFIKGEIPCDLPDMLGVCKKLI